MFEIILTQITERDLKYKYVTNRILREKGKGN